MRGKLIIVDAIDGAGKSNAIGAFADALREKGLRLFDLVAYAKQHNRLPEITDPEVQASDVMLSAEPTFTWIGAAIREEIIKAFPDRRYDGFVVADACALDRGVLFSRLIIPYLEAKANRWVIQDRGLITSLVYQPAQDERVTLASILSLDGNKRELARPPDLLLLLRLNPAVAQQRLAGRTEKQDGHIFETQTFQEKIADRYRDETVLAPYRAAGTKIVEIDASKTPEEVRAAVRETLRLLP